MPWAPALNRVVRLIIISNKHTPANILALELKTISDFIFSCTNQSKIDEIFIYVSPALILIGPVNPVETL